MHDASADDAGGLALSIERIWSSPAVAFDPGCTAVLRDAAASLGYPARDMMSGAGHDSAYVARVAPTAMIFVPCAGGLSHNEAESADQDHVAAGAAVLLEAVLATDRRLAEASREKQKPGS